MSTKEFVLGIFGLLVVVAIAALIAVVSINRHKTDAEIKAKAATEQVRITQEAKLDRTKERMNAIPWYKGGEGDKRKSP